MPSRAVAPLAILISLSLSTPNSAAGTANAAGEYSNHLAALRELSVAVAQAMPAERYGFRPHAESMDFGQLMSHIAITNYQFCAGLKDSDPPAFPATTGQGAVVKFLSDSFDYCSSVIPTLTDEQLNKTHNSHHRGQAEIYLRDNGIRPPSYRI